MTVYSEFKHIKPVQEYFSVPSRVLSCFAVSYLDVSCRAVSYRVVYCRVVPCRVVPCRFVPCHVVFCRAVSCRVVFCRGVSCRVVFCRVVPFSALPCLEVWIDKRRDNFTFYISSIFQKGMLCVNFNNGHPIQTISCLTSYSTGLKVQ
jgi:hypothetical protein